MCVDPILLCQPSLALPMHFYYNIDGRVVFVIPYEGDFTLIGTTDQNHEGDPKDVYCTPEEVTYLCGVVSRT